MFELESFLYVSVGFTVPLLRASDLISFATGTIPRVILEPVPESLYVAILLCT